MSETAPTFSADDEKRFDEWYASIPNDADWPDLSQADRTLLLIYRFDAEVSNGGIRQFFANPQGDMWRQTLEALREVRANEVVKIFERALDVFPGRSPSTDHLTRSEKLRHESAEVHDFLHQLTTEYYDLYKEYPGEGAYAIMIRSLASRG